MIRLTRTHATLAVAAGALAVATSGTAAVAGSPPVSAPPLVPALVELTTEIADDTVPAVPQVAPSVPTAPSRVSPGTPTTPVDVAVAAAVDTHDDGLCDKL